MLSREHDRQLLDATEQLIHEWDSGRVPAGRVIAIVARAKIHLRELYERNQLTEPGPEDFTTAVIAMARQELTTHHPSGTI
jgi:hypothetical protein